MGFLQARQGKDKVAFWVIILIGLLCASLGLRLGAAWSSQIVTLESGTEALKNIWQSFSQFARKNLHVDTTEDILANILAVIIAIAVIVLCSKFRPKKRKSAPIKWQLTLEEMQVQLYLLVTILCAVMAYQDPESAKWCSFMLCILTVFTVGQLVMVLKDIDNERNSIDHDYFERCKKSVLFKATGLGLALVGFVLWIPDFWGFTLPQILENADLLDYYIALLSLTFISISVMSVLSDRSVVIYWENIAESKLIKPVFISFAAYTFYSVGAAIGAGISVVLDNHTAFIIFCALNIITMVLLTFTMVDVYYDRESKKVKHIRDLKEDLDDYLWVRKNEDMADGSPEEKEASNADAKNKKMSQMAIRGKKIGHRRYEDKMLGLCQHISRANDEHDLLYLQEVYEMYPQHLRCFDTLAGKPVVSKLFADCPAESWQLVTKSIRSSLTVMEQEQKKQEAQAIAAKAMPKEVKKTLVARLMDFFAGTPEQQKPLDVITPFEGATHWDQYRWDQDHLLWIALNNSPYFRQWLQEHGRSHMDGEELRDFILLIARRLVVLYNDMVTHCNVVWGGNYDHLTASLKNQAIQIQTTKGDKPSPEQIHRVYEETSGLITVESCFAIKLMQTIAVMLDNLAPAGIEALEQNLLNFSLLSEFTFQLNAPEFTQAQIDQWKKSFPIPKKSDPALQDAPQ